MKEEREANRQFLILNPPSSQFGEKKNRGVIDLVWSILSVFFRSNIIGQLLEISTKQVKIVEIPISFKVY